MEQGQFWMWTKRKYSMSSSNLIASPTKPSSSSYDDSSWEEQAFAEDASGPLGGCIWPPRSYTCSFCRREFRSAQALGGHMNVHRRDRARLKQPSSPQNNELQIPNPSSFMGFLYPYNNSSSSATNPNSYQPNSVLVASSASNKALPPSSNIEGTMIIPAYNSSSIIPPQGHKASSYSPFYSSSKSNWPNVAEAEAEKITEALDSGCEDIDNEKTDLAFSLNLVMCRGIETKEEEAISCKKRRISEASSILPLFPNSNSSVEFSPSSIEELDLELRLGQSKHKRNQDMEFSLRNNDKSKRMRWSDSEEQTQVKSYPCAFCQKGFSNAQALGGHMNIHRRDRAKLRQQYSQENLLSLDVSSVKNPNDLIHHDEHQNPQDLGDKISLHLDHQEKKMELDLELRLGPEPERRHHRF